jgi:hypothetical protein
MAYLYLSPDWFLGYDVALELLFALVSLLVGILALRVHKESGQPFVKLFGAGFIFIAASYFLHALFNLIIISEARQNPYLAINFITYAYLKTLGFYAHLFFMTLGLSILAYMTFKTDKQQLFWLLFLLSLAGITLSKNDLYTFYITTTILTFFISLHFTINFVRNKNTKTFLVFLAFLLLFISKLHFVFSIHNNMLYALGHIIELIAYGLIGWNFYLVRKR